MSQINNVLSYVGFIRFCSAKIKEVNVKMNKFERIVKEVKEENVREYSLTKIYGKDFLGCKHVEKKPYIAVTDYRWNKKDYAMAGLVSNLLSQNSFDGFGVIRCDLDGDIRNTGKYPFLAFSWEEVVRKWLGATVVKENTNTKVNYTLHFPMQIKAIDAVKDNSRERRLESMKKFSSWMDEMSTQVKPIMARPYKKEEK